MKEYGVAVLRGLYPGMLRDILAFRCGRRAACFAVPRLRGSTLAETLVMMLVAGIVFLAVMDGMTLFSRLQVRRTEALLSSGRLSHGYYRLVALVARADSIRTRVPGLLDLYSGDGYAELSLRDSVLVYRAGEFRDTLLTGIGMLRLDTYEGRADTLGIGFGNGFAPRFAVPAAARQYLAALEQIEKDYGYEE